MKRKFIKYIMMAACLVSFIILLFLYNARMEYRQHQVDRASEQLHLDLDYDDVEAIDEGWENIDRAMEKVNLDTLEKNKNRR
jgi:hypothetical protein